MRLGAKMSVTLSIILARMCKMLINVTSPASLQEGGGSGRGHTHVVDRRAPSCLVGWDMRADMRRSKKSEIGNIGEM